MHTHTHEEILIITRVLVSTTGPEFVADKYNFCITSS
jgi:hypothetical protein